MTSRLLLRRKGHIDLLCLQALCKKLFLDFLLMLADGLLDADAGLIDHLSDLRAILCRNILHSLQNTGELSLFAKKINLDLIDFFRRKRLLQTFMCLLPDPFQIFLYHISFSYP